MIINHENLCQIRVRYAETDQMGYCYYGNYPAFLEVGRVEALRTLGLTYKNMEEKGHLMPVSDLKIKYLRPAMYDDLLTILTRVLRIEGSRIYFDYVIFNEKKERILTATTTLVFVSKSTMRPTPPPDYFLNLFHAQ
jgi:acyl-CoA thioester hydrolase